ncbi:MAG: 16S rRNA (cytosine(1402)-N(4))-methyltransferase RsmH [Firmicutes bacterium]|nr:16S rRNA (cytosine(1402)-N(4))-methyltransferase RsmH [Bacillota bacterium]
MEFSHVPVLLNEVLEGLNVRENGIYVDGTLGGAGHGREIAARLGAGGIFVGIDRDRDALDASRSRLADLPCRVELVQSNYSQIKLVMSELGLPGLDGALLDLGVSSFQLDNPERGFSYIHDAPLDMRMNADDSLTAEDVVNGYPKEELARIIRDYGEERWAGRIADFIVRARAEKRLTSTFELVDVIKAAVPASARRDGPHPAKRTFQALRIEVNDELGQLRTAVDDFIDCLAPGGRLAIISFHSLEDRIVKESFQKRLNPCVCPPDLPVCVCGRKPDIKKVTRKPVTASAAELGANPRARSAKLRVIEKLERES